MTKTMRNQVSPFYAMVAEDLQVVLTCSDDTNK